MEQKQLDRQFMARAIELAQLGKGSTSPNPCVGAVIVRDSAIIGEGWHKAAGKDHAEIVALKAIDYNAIDATIYITLEPCSSYGRTPPCTEAIINSGIKRVVVAMADPDPRHQGQGLKLLRNQGIETSCGVLCTQAMKLNPGFIKVHTLGMPYVIAKSAMTLDGKIATTTGDSQWITNKKSRSYGHKLRNECDGVLVGIGTAEADDPELTVRHVRSKKQPRRIVVDSTARISLKSKLLTHDSAESTIIAVTAAAPEKNIAAIRARGAEVIVCRAKQGQVSLKDLFKKLAKLEIQSILIEGGSAIITNALERKLVDEIAFFYAPKLIGGTTAPTPFGGSGIKLMQNALSLKELEIKNFDDNILVRGMIEYPGKNIKR